MVVLEKQKKMRVHKIYFVICGGLVVKEEIIKSCVVHPDHHLSQQQNKINARGFFVMR